MLGAMELGSHIKKPVVRYGLMGLLAWQLYRMSKDREGMGAWAMSVDGDSILEKFGLGANGRILVKKLFEGLSK